MLKANDWKCSKSYIVELEMNKPSIIIISDRDIFTEINNNALAAKNDIR